MTRLSEWEVAPKIWAILASWGLAVLMLTGLVSWKITANEREADRERAAVQVEQDRAMCSMIAIFLTGPEPVAGPAGDRSRSVREGMTRYRGTLRCDQIGA